MGDWNSRFGFQGSGTAMFMTFLFMKGTRRVNLVYCFCSPVDFILDISLGLSGLVIVS